MVTCQIHIRCTFCEGINYYLSWLKLCTEAEFKSVGIETDVVEITVFHDCVNIIVSDCEEVREGFNSDRWRVGGDRQCVLIALCSYLCASACWAKIWADFFFLWQQKGLLIRLEKKESAARRLAPWLRSLVPTSAPPPKTTATDHFSSSISASSLGWSCCSRICSDRQFSNPPYEFLLNSLFFCLHVRGDESHLNYS